MAETEIVKLQKHLSLLREEYVKLQNKHTELERKYNLLSSIAGNQRFENNADSFICRILKTISDLFDKDLYSDLVIKLDGHTLKAHRFVLDARSKNWGVSSLAQINELDFTALKYDIGYNLIKWVYTDVFDNQKWDENFYLEMMKEASRYDLKDLKEKCEDGLLTFVNVKNCIKFYEVAEEISANKLKAHCNQLISNHWDDFTSDDFAHMPAALLYSMFKSKTNFPLHAAIKAKREDVVFLYLIENDANLHIKLNEVDEKNDLPLDLALRSKQESIAQNLVRSRADVNRIDTDGCTLLHKAISRTDEYAASFLVENNIRLDLQKKSDKRTALMSIASIDPFKLNNEEQLNGMLNVAKIILQRYSSNDLNVQDANGNTCLHIAINSNNKVIFNEIIRTNKPNMDLKNNLNELPIWLALQKSENDDDFSNESFASSLISNGCNFNITVDNKTGDTLLHVCARKNLENSSVFLVNKNIDINKLNINGESILHIACENGLHRLVKILLEKGSDPNVQTRLTVSHDDNDANISSQTPMHRAILNNHEDILKLFVAHKELCEKKSTNLKSIPNFNLKDSEGQSILSLCIWNNSLSIAKNLIDHGADVNIIDYEGTPLLHQAILRQCTDGALFLLNQNVNLNIKSSENLSALQLAVKRHLPLVVENLCKRGANMSILDSDGNSPLWNALDTGQEEIATILVLNGCDTTQWSKGPDDCLQTLLHRAIDENNESVAVFLIKSNCDVNSPRRAGLNGETPDEAKDGQTPLHLACTWGQEKVVNTLVEHNCAINKQDSEGNTPLHVAILNQNASIIEILVKHPDVDLKIKNNNNQTPFAIALMKKNNKAASLILHREPKAAEQLDNKGRNFLHTSVLASDIETVLLLLSVKVNINSRVQDSLSKTALHIAVETGSEMIVRNLILAGAKINDVTANKKNALHLLAELNHPHVGSICQILLENKVDFNAVDSQSNNALHIAVQNNNLAVVKVLLAQCDVDVYAMNSKGMSPLHLLGAYGKENSTLILDSFLETLPTYNLDQKDQKGNSCLLLAYQNGNGNLCRALVKCGAALGAYNEDGLSIFNFPVATKQLLYKLLDIVTKEPPWVECETCLECKTKFSLTIRKHHCRHCGRVLCKKCSEKEIPILKFQIQKPVRACDICFDVLTAGSDRMSYNYK